MFNYQFNSMSTLVQLSINKELFANDMMPVYKLFELVETTCSRFRTDSELTRLNLQVGKEVSLSNVMFSILKETEHFYKETEGIFNPSVLTALETSGYSRSIEQIRGQRLEGPVGTTTSVVTFLPFLLNERRQTVILHSKIDLGGIAKGWVIDRATRLLEKVGDYGFINVGGDICTFGELPRPLNVGIESPFDHNQMISSIQVDKGAVATSTSMKRKWVLNGENQHHLIDPRTGKPADSMIVSATVTAPTALEADIWAKTVLLLGKEKGQQWITHKGVQAVLINKDKKIWRGGKEYGTV